MKDIFISYAREDGSRAAELAAGLEAQGWSVFWDRDIPSGQTWRTFVGRHLDEARCVIVAWSVASIESHWVHEEADDARQRHVLVPVLFDAVTPPIGFRSVQAGDLVGWDGTAEAGAFGRLVNDVARLLGPPPRIEMERQVAVAEAARQEEARQAPAAEAARQEKARQAAVAEAAPKAEAKATAPPMGHEVAHAAAAASHGSLPPVAESDSGSLAAPGSNRQSDGSPRSLGESTPQGESTTSPSRPVWLRPVVLGSAAVVAIVLGVQLLPDRGTTNPASGLGDAARTTESSEPPESASGTSGTVVPSPPAGSVDPLNRPVWIEGGTFQMGITDGESDERPVHPVTVSGFWIQEHEVTNEEYRRFIPGHSFPAGQERHPVVNVNWQQAMDYAGSLGGSLPTEAQWEFAARGTAGRTYPWGEAAPTCALAQMFGCDGDAIAVMSRPAGATPEGVHDLAGNVWEWVKDWYGPYPSAAQTDPNGPASGSSRVMRGGSFRYDPNLLRGSFRSYREPGYVSANRGFRVAWPGGQ